MKDNITLIITILGAVGGWTMSVGLFAWWLSNQFKETRHSLRGAMDQRYEILDEKIDGIDSKVDKIIIHIARTDGIEL